MMEIGRRIYYDIITGNVILDTGEKCGFVKESSIEQDFESYTILKAYNPETIGVIQLEYGQYAQDFRECNGYRVNPETQQIEFSYPDPDDLEPQEPIYQKPLSEEVADLKQAIAELTMILGGISQ